MQYGTRSLEAYVFSEECSSAEPDLVFYSTASDIYRLLRITLSKSLDGGLTGKEFDAL